MLLVSSRQSPPTWVTNRTWRETASKAVRNTATHSRRVIQPQRHNIPSLALERVGESSAGPASSTSAPALLVDAGNNDALTVCSQRRLLERVGHAFRSNTRLG